MTGQDGEIRALRRLVHEIQQEPAPEVDWDALERRVAAQIEREAASPRAAGSWRWKVAALALAAGIMFVAGVGTLGRLDAPEPKDAEHSAESSLPPSHVDGDKLPVGRRIVAGTAPIVVEHAGRASWTLEPHSHAWLAATGERLTLRLEFGSVLASVVPSDVSESFAVEVGHTRVAVHGTVFRVELTEDHTQVDVRQGTVSVRATDGEDRGWLLSAPATGRFSLDGERLDTAELKQPARRPSPAGPRPSSAGSPPDAARRDAPAIDLPAHPDQATLELAADKVADVVRRCFAETTSAPGAVHVSASSSMTVDFGPDGKLQKLEFDPPLAPAVRACSAAGVSSIVVPASQNGAASTRVVHLG